MCDRKRTSAAIYNTSSSPSPDSYPLLPSSTHTHPHLPTPRPLPQIWSPIPFTVRKPHTPRPISRGQTFEIYIHHLRRRDRAGIRRCLTSRERVVRESTTYHRQGVVPKKDRRNALDSFSAAVSSPAPRASKFSTSPPPALPIPTYSPYNHTSHKQDLNGYSQTIKVSVK